MKKAVVTGSVKGIGKSIGIKLLQEGCFVIFNYAQDDSAADTLNQELGQQYEGYYKIIQSDLSTYQAVVNFAHICIETAGTIDYLVLNAGSTSKTPFLGITPEDWNRIMDINLNMPVFLVQQLFHHIKAQGSILFIGSVMGMEPHAISLSYGVSKAGVHFLVKSLVKEFSDRQITVNALAPGFVDTPWQKNKAPDHRKRIEDKIALHRFALPEEIAELSFFVLQNHYMNGSIVRIDGGYCYK